MSRSIDFMGWLRPALGLSCSLIFGSILALTLNGLNFGLDFTGGLLMELRFPHAVDAEVVRRVAVDHGHPTVVVQTLGSESEMVVRAPTASGGHAGQSADRLLAGFREAYPDIEVERIEVVGPAVGEELRETAGLAILASLGAMCAYLMWRFTLKFALAALIALVHDVIITVGAFAVFRWSFDLAVVAAVLSVIGYSLNDTIVICDRIRENLRRMSGASLAEVINRSLNQTLERTLIMSGTTLLVLVALLVAGGPALRGFAAALTIGVVVGTYSSIYVAAAFLMQTRVEREDLMPEPDEQPAAGRSRRAA